HRVAAVFDDHGLIVEAPDVGQRLLQDGRFGNQGVHRGRRLQRFRPNEIAISPPAAARRCRVGATGARGRGNRPPMEILMVAAELSPYARAGETADSVAALSRMLVQLGHEVTVALPRYPSFEEQGLLVARRLPPLRRATGGSVTGFGGQLGSGVKIALFDGPEFFARPGVYGEGDAPYPDNPQRFALLAQAAAALAVQRAGQGQAFDV